MRGAAASTSTASTPPEIPDSSPLDVTEELQFLRSGLESQSLRTSCDLRLYPAGVCQVCNRHSMRPAHEACLPGSEWMSQSAWHPSFGESITRSSDPLSLALSQSRSNGIVCNDSKNRVEWSQQEDQLLMDLIAKHGTTKWSLIASSFSNKTNKHCRRRWQACVNAIGNKGAWTREEDAKLIEGHRRYGNRWTEIARLVPGRTDNAAKNRFGALSKGNVTYSSCTSPTSVVPEIGTCGKAEGDFDNFYQAGVKRGSEEYEGNGFGSKKARCVKLNRAGSSGCLDWGRDGVESKKSPESSVDNGPPRPRGFDLNFPASFFET